MIELVKVAPAVFGSEKWVKRTDKYQHVSTSDILDVFEENGWRVHAAQQVRNQARTMDRRDFSKHIVTFRNDKFPKINGLFPEIHVLNSHDGSTSFEMFAGLYRMVCSNGLIVSDAEFSKFKVRHSRLAPEIISDGIKQIVEIVPQIVGKSENMNTLILSPVDRLNLSTNIIERVWEDPKVRPLEASQLLQSRRSEDREHTLWNTYNTIQENIIKGGLVGKTSNGKSRVQRKVASIDRNIKYNQIMWEETDKFLQAA